MILSLKWAQRNIGTMQGLLQIEPAPQISNSAVALFFVCAFMIMSMLKLFHKNDKHSTQARPAAHRTGSHDQPFSFVYFVFIMYNDQVGFHKNVKRSSFGLSNFTRLIRAAQHICRACCRYVEPALCDQLLSSVYDTFCVPSC